MSTLRQSSVHTIPDQSRYVRPPAAGPLPFRSRDAANHVKMEPQEPYRVKWHDFDSPSLMRNTAHRQLSPGNKENIRSWLETKSPTSVIEEAQRDTDPSTPSPICSPTLSSPVCSPRPSIFKSKTELIMPSSEIVPVNTAPRGTDAPSSSKRPGKEIVPSSFDAPPDSPTGSSVSSTSEGGLLAFIASKLMSYKEHSRSLSRYARERSGPIDDKHVMEDRGRKPPVEEIFVQERPVQLERPQPNDHLLRTSSEAASELSLGSANGRTLSMEFDAMLAAAVAAGVERANAQGASAELETAERDHLPGIEEDRSLRITTAADGAAYRDDASNASVVTRQGSEGEEVDMNSISELALSSPSSSRGSRRAESEEMEIVPVLPQSSSNSSRGSVRTQSPENAASNPNASIYRSISSASATNTSSRNDLALVVVNDRSADQSSSRSSVSISKEQIAPISRRQALEKVRRDKILARSLAYQDAENSKYDNRYKREEAKINAWENQQKINANVRMKKAEMKLEKQRAKAFEKMQNELARAHKKAQERKASAQAVRGLKLAQVAEVADNIRGTGKVPGGCFPF